MRRFPPFVARAAGTPDPATSLPDEVASAPWFPTLPETVQVAVAFAAARGARARYIGGSLEFIVAYRERHGCGLREAVEALGSEPGPDRSWIGLWVGPLPDGEDETRVVLTLAGFVPRDACWVWHVP